MGYVYKIAVVILLMIILKYANLLVLYHQHMGTILQKNAFQYALQGNIETVILDNAKLLAQIVGLLIHLQ